MSVLALNARCVAAETMAYHFGHVPTAPDGNVASLASQAPLLEQPPSPTLFVTAGDKLHDLTPLLRDNAIPLKGGWAIWNQTQQLVIVHASALDQWRVEGLLQFKKQLQHARLTVEWLRTDKEKPTAPPDSFASVMVSGRSGQRFSGTVATGELQDKWTFQAEAEPTIDDEESRFLDCRIALDWKATAVENAVKHGSFSTSVSMLDGDGLELAAWRIPNDPTAWHIIAKADLVLSDGTLWREARRREVDRSIAPFALDNRLHPPEFDQLATVKGQKLMVLPMSLQFISSFLDPSDTASPSTAHAVVGPPKLPALPAARIPNTVADALDGEFLDLRPFLESNGISFKPNDFAGYDPLAARLFVWFADPLETDKVEALFTGGCFLVTKPTTVKCWLLDPAATGHPLEVTLTGRSGMKTAISLEGTDDQPLLAFEVEPTIGDNDDMLDVRHFFQWAFKSPSGTYEGQTNSSLTLSRGRAFLSDVAKTPDGKTWRQGMSAELKTMGAVP